jgi:DNA-binding GntR family transcriptional regulator
MAAISPTPPLDAGHLPVTAHEFVHDTLRRAVLSGALPGGTRLLQADIAAQLSVSTTPVREALRDLAAEGLVVFKPHSGAVVRELNIVELAELYDIRRALEPLAIRRAAALISPEEIAAAQALAREMEQENDPARWTELNRRFHHVVEEASQAPLILSVLKGVQDIAAIYVAHVLARRPSRIASGNKEHRALLAALRKHDGEAAARLQAAHLDATLQAIQQADDEQSAGGALGRKQPAPTTPSRIGQLQS